MLISQCCKFCANTLCLINYEECMDWGLIFIRFQRLYYNALCTVGFVLMSKSHLVLVQKKSALFVENSKLHKAFFRSTTITFNAFRHWQQQQHKIILQRHHRSNFFHFHRICQFWFYVLIFYALKIC